MDRQSILQKLRVKQHDDEAEVWQNSSLLNRDNVPLPPSRRTWGPWSFIGYWVTTGVQISGWTGGSALLSLGLSVGQAMAAVVVGQCLVALAVVATGLVGAHWHVGFPMWNRMTWGMKASYFPLLNRIILSFTWNATQAWFGGQVVKTLLGSLAPSIYRMHNVFPEDSHLTSVDFLCFCIFLILSLPLLYIPPEHFRKPFLFTAASSTICCFSIFIWSLARAKGAGPLVKGGDNSAIIGVQPLSGSALVWGVFYAISSQMGGICAGILNMSDYTRFASKPTDQVLSQLVVVPVMGTLTCLIGIICTSTAAEFYPSEGLLWEPYNLLTVIQQNGGNGARAAVFFASLSFLFAQFGINIAGNAVSGGIDLASMFPRYINIRRGEYITTLMSLPMCPWALLSGATVYISVMGGYATFLAPMTGIMVCDYVFVRNFKMKLSALYDPTPNSAYYYWRGVNWRAPVAWALATAPVFPGFLSTVSTVTVPIGLERVYYLCWPLGFTLAAVIYFGLAKLFPIPQAREVDEYDIFGTFGEPTGPPVEDHDDKKDMAIDTVTPVHEEV